MSNAIKAITNLPGWEEIKNLFDDEILSNLDTSHIKESLSAEHIKMEVMTRNKAAKIVKNVLKKIDKIANAEEIKPKISYK